MTEALTEYVPVEHLPYANELTTRLPYTESELRVRIAQAIGVASACWENLAGAGVFDSDRAVAVSRELTADVLRLTGLGEPSLGCATNAQLEAELAARRAIGNNEPPYRTVGGD